MISRLAWIALVHVMLLPAFSAPAAGAAKRSSSQAAPAPSERDDKTPGRSLGVFTLRAYCPRLKDGTERGLTATGTVPAVDRTIAVDPEVIPLGSRIHIDGIGERTAEDVGGKIKGRSLDLFLTQEKCEKFGVQRKAVRMIEEGRTKSRRPASKKPSTGR